MEWIGTSGFQYPEWKEKFYPAALKTRQMLEYYAATFSSTEINYTFRRVPSEQTINTWKAETPDAFQFSFKAPQRITHFARLKGCDALLKVFLAAVCPMEQKLGVVLFQLPPQFKKDSARLREFVRSLPKAGRYAFEFRDESWFDDEIFEIVRNSGVALCLAENEEFATPREATANFGYLRLRREDYTLRRLDSWAQYLRAQDWTDTYCYFKHEDRAVGPKFARQFAEILAVT